MLDLRRVDLHTHTRYSDGVLTPTELVRKARKHQIHALSITDHDTIEGYEEALEAGNQFGVEIISGVELSITLADEEMHLLGYFFDPDSVLLREHLHFFREERRKRVERMVERLNNLGVPLDFDDVLAKAGGAALGRPHVASALVEGGYVDTYQDAFVEYLRDDGAAYVSKTEFDAREALHTLHEAGGIGVLAHPGNWTSGAALKELIRYGLDGIEVIHPSHDFVLTRYYRQIAREFGLIETGGSDYHGIRPEEDRRLRQYSISYPYLERIREAKMSG